MTNLNPEETAALAAEPQGLRPRGQVQPRNFAEPRSLSTEQLHVVRALVSSCLQSAGNALAGPLRSFHRISLTGVQELSVETLFDDFQAPFIVHNFMAGGEIAWAVWDSAFAGRAVDVVVSGDAASSDGGEARLLSRSEVSVVSGLLDKVTAVIGTKLGIQVEPGSLAQKPDDLVPLGNSGPHADNRRLRLHLVVDGPLGTSDLSLYLPARGLFPAADASRQEQVPDHLDDVLLDVRAYLGAVDLPLQDLLSLEVGDVLPLGVDLSEPIEVYVEERACAKGSWGQFNGTLAVRLDELDLHPGDIDCPNPD